MVDLERLNGHTPGPWEVRKGGGWVGPIDGPCPPHVVRVYEDDKGRRCTDYIVTATHTIPDATLCAAAPDLLAEVRALRAERDALKGLKDEYKDGLYAAEHDKSVLTKARDAALARVQTLEQELKDAALRSR
jgi:hypothetical protein